MVFFMFVLKISKKIEISVKLPTMEERVQKLVYFPVLPNTLYIEEKTKKDFVRHVDLDNRREDFMRQFPKFFMEMDDNYQFSLNHRLMYLISKNDTFYKLKFLCWIIGFYINVLCFVFLELNDVSGGSNLDSRKLQASDYKNLINISSIAFSGLSTLLFLTWLFFRFSKQNRIKKFDFMKEYPNADPNTFGNKLYIGIRMTFLADSSA